LSIAFATREAAAAELPAFDHMLDIVSPAAFVAAVVEWAVPRPARHCRPVGR